MLRDTGIRSEIRTYRRPAFNRATRYQLHVAGEAHALEVLVAAGVVDRRHAPLARPPRAVVGRACCRAAYFRGTFLGSGSLSVTRNPHVELRSASRVSAAFLSMLAAVDGIQLAVAERATHSVAYAKSWETIESLLALMGASETVLALEERAVVAETSAFANRLANADQANLVRTTHSARLQLDAIEQLRDADRLEQLPDPLREAAELRLRHPAESLRELAERTDPPITKAAMHRRYRRLDELAARLA